MRMDTDAVVERLLERHTPDAPEAGDWGAVVRGAGRRHATGIRHRLRWVPAAAGALAIAALIGALIVAAPGGDDTAAPPASAASATVQVYLSDAAAPAQVEHLRTTLEAMRDEGRITSFTYESKQDALARLRARLRDPSILDELPSNPLPASFEVTVAPGASRQAVVAALSTETAVDPELGITPGVR